MEPGDVGGLVSASTGQEELAQLFLNLESLPSTDEALDHLMMQQQYNQQQQQQQQQQQYNHHQPYFQQHQQPYGQQQYHQTSSSSTSAGPFDLPQIEPFGVKEETPSPPPASVGISLGAALFHKPRGSQGAWVAIPSHDRIRVTKGKGKKLRLEIRSNKTFDLSELNIWLSDDEGSSLQGFTIDTTKSKIEMESTGACVATVEVNLIKISKQLRFGVRVASVHGWSCQAATYPFVAHNNGKDRVQHSGPSLSPTSPGYSQSSPTNLSPELHPLPPMASGKKRKVAAQQEVSSAAHASSPEALLVGEKVTQLEGTLRVEGDVRARSFIQFSDLRLKTDVASLVDALHIIETLEPKSYKWLPHAPGASAPEEEDDGRGGRRAIGLIAQEVQKVLPDVVYQDPVTGYLAVAYTELVPVIIEALKEHLKGYAADKAHFQNELDALRTALAGLQAGRSAPADGGDDDDDNVDNVDNDDDEDDDDEDDNNGGGPMKGNPKEIVKTVKQRKKELRELARQLNRIQKDAKRQHKQEKLERKAEKLQRKSFKAERKVDKAAERMAKKEKKKFQEHLMMDPIKLNKDVLRYQALAFKLATKQGAKLAVALFWDRGSIPDLSLHVHKPNMAMRDNTREKKKKCASIVTIRSLPRLTADNDNSGGEEEEDEEAAVLGQYNVSVTLHGGFAFHLKKSRAVVAVYDFREASTQPLYVTSASVAGDMGQTWLVGSFLVGRNAVFRWTKTPNVIAPGIPEEWRYAKDDKGQGEMRGYGLLPRRVYLRSPKGGHYLSASRDGALTCTQPAQEDNGKKAALGFEEAWDVEFDVDGFASLRSSHGAYLSVGPKGTFTTVEADKGAGSSEKFRYLLDDATSTLALVALLPTPAYLHVSPSGELAASDACRPYTCDGEEMMPGQKEGGQPPASGDGTPASPTLVRHKAGRGLSKAGDCESDSMDEEDDDDEDEDDDDDDSVEEEVFAHPGEGEASRRQHQKQKQPLQAGQQMRLPVETERWVMEAAPTRDQQQARQAQEVWAQLQQNFSLLSLSASLRSGPPM